MSKLPKQKIGITGTMGSGKTSVTKIINEKYKVISADDIVKELYKNKNIVVKINCEILNVDSKKLDKTKLSNVIFSDVKLKEKLESFIHPLVKTKIKKWLLENEGMLFVEVPLLYEAKFEDLFDSVIVVVADQDKIIERLKKSRGYSCKETLSRIKHQLSVNEKIKRANYVIYNNATYKQLIFKVNRILSEIEVSD